MIKLLLTIIIIFLLKASFCPLFSIDLPFNYERLMVDFKGVAYNERSVICFGTGGIIFRSTDRGDKWSQIKIAPDVYAIQKIINVSSKYFGLLDSNYFISSENDGVKWNLSEIIGEHSYFDLDADSSLIYFLGSSKIFVFNFELNKISEINIDSDWGARAIRIHKSKAILSIKNSRLALFDLEKSGNVSIVELGPLMANRKYEVPSQLKVIEDTIYARVADELFKSTDFGISWMRILVNSGYFEINNSIYSIKSSADQTKNISFIEFYRADSSSFTRLNSNEITRYVSSQEYSDFKFLNTDTIIAVGKDKLINMSYDGGKTWNFKCNLRSVSYCFSNWVNDTLGYFYTDKYQISKTTDAGVTWLPQFYNYQSKGLYEFSVPNVRYVDEEGNVILYSKTDLFGKDNLIYSKDYGEHYLTLSNSNLSGHLDDIYSPLIIKKDTSFLLFYCIQEVNNTYSTAVAELNSELSVINEWLIDSLTFIFVKRTGNKDELLAIAMQRLYSNNINNNVSFYILYSYDYGKTWNKYFKFNINLRFLQSISEIDSKIILNSYIQDSTKANSYLTSIDILDHKEKKFFPGTFKDTVFIYNFYKLGNSIYGSTYENILIYNDNFLQNKYNWKILRNLPFVAITPNYSNGKIAYCVGAYDYKKSYLYKFTPLIPDKVAEEITNYPQYFYPMKPYPIPAENQISCHIYTTIDFALDKTEVAVYDISGVMVAEKSQITMNRASIWEWDLIWDCRSETNGIYLIVFKDGSSTFSLPVVVQR